MTEQFNNQTQCDVENLSTNEKIAKSITKLGECGLKLCNLSDLNEETSMKFAKDISETIDNHPEFKMLSLAPEDLLEKNMVVIVDHSSDDKLVACGGSGEPSDGQVEIGTLITVPDVDQKGEPKYRGKGFSKLVTAVLTKQAHDNGYTPIAFCNPSSAPIFEDLGYYEAYMQEEINYDSLSACEAGCVAYKQAKDKINKEEFLSKIENAKDEKEKERLEKLLVSFDSGEKPIKCCDTIYVLPKGEEIKYD